VPCEKHHAAFCKDNNIKDEGAKARVLRLEDFSSAVHRGRPTEVKKARGSIWEQEYTVVALTMSCVSRRRQRLRNSRCRSRRRKRPRKIRIVQWPSLTGVSN
jgi:hypothetical protein